MNFSSYFSRQARKPGGLFGWLIAPWFFEKGNAELNDFVYDALAYRTNDRLLEIGFGTGLLMNKIAGHLKEGVIEGIDFSHSMVRLAKRKNRTYIKTNKVEIHSGDFDVADFEEGVFNRIFTVNTIYFWQNPTDTISKIHRLLKSGGKVVIGFHARHEMEKMPLSRDIFRYYTTDDMKKLLATRWDRKNIQILQKKSCGKTCYCAVAEKRAGG